MSTIGTQAIGSIVKLNVGGVPTNFIVVHQGNPSASLYGGNPDGTWVLMENIYTTMYHGVSTNSITKSQIPPYLNETFFGLLDSDIQSYVQEIKFPYMAGAGHMYPSLFYTGENGLSAKVFLLGGYEVGWTTSTVSTMPEDGACLSYFNGCSATDSKRIARYDGRARAWHLRSPVTGESRSYHGVNVSGGRAPAGTHDGVRPALVLNSGLSVKSDGTITATTTRIIGNVNINGVLKNLTDKAYVNINGVWKPIVNMLMCVDGVWKSMFSASRLPTGYTEIEYIESTGTQFIDTGFMPNHNTRVVMDAYVTAKTAIQALFGARNATKLNAFDVFAIGSSDGGGYQTDYAEESTVKNDISCSGRHTVDKNKNLFTVDGTLLNTHSTVSFSCSYNLYLFTNNNGGSTMVGTFPTSAKLYSCQMYDNGTLIRDFVPCKNASGAAGLYDLVNDQFYGNGGSGSFTAGSNVT